MTGLFVDTSAWYALVDREEPRHESILPVLEEHEGRLLTSDFVFDETLTLARHRLGYSVARQLGEAIRSGSVAQLVQVSAEDQESAWRLFCRRHDQRLSFTDCTSFVLIQRLKLSGVITLDADFRSLGLTTLP